MMIKNISKEWKELKGLVVKIYIFLFMKWAKRKAFQIHKKYNCEVFVVKIGGNIRIITKRQFKIMRQRGLIKKNFTAEHLKKIALYYTPKFYDKKRV